MIISLINRCLLADFDQSVASVIALVNDGDFLAIRISEDKERMRKHFHLYDGFIHIHIFDIKRLRSYRDLFGFICFFIETLGQRFFMSSGKSALLSSDLIFQFIDRQIDGGLEILMNDF